MDKRRVMGHPIKRLDGPVKSSGRAKYNSDIHPQGMLWATLVTSPHAHARVTSIDLSPAQKMPGVTAVRAIKKAGDEVQWAGTEIASVAAINEEIARDAARAVDGEVRSPAAPGQGAGPGRRPAIAPNPRASRWRAIPTRRSRTPT